MQSRRHRRHIRVASDLEFEMEGRWERRREGRKRGERKGGTPVWELGMLGMAEWLGTRDGELEVEWGCRDALIVFWAAFFKGSMGMSHKNRIQLITLGLKHLRETKLR